MKVLVISDKQEIIDLVSKYLTKNHYDVIVYRWLLKALDNIEEIHPDIIFLSSSEYPRHWKTLASFVKSGIGGDNVRLYLYDPEPLSPDEMKKAQNLGVEGFINSINEEELSKIGCNQVENISDDKKVVEDYEMILNNPFDGKFITCVARCVKGSDIFDCDCNHNNDDFKLHSKVNFVSAQNKVSKQIISFEAEIINKADKNKISLKAIKYYD